MSIHHINLLTFAHIHTFSLSSHLCKKIAKNARFCFVGEIRTAHEINYYLEINKTEFKIIIALN